MAIEDPLAAFQFDQAVAVWAGFIEQELDKIDGEKPEQVAKERGRRLDQLLGRKEAPGRFADPAMLFEKK